MGAHFVLLVDHLLTESSLAAAAERCELDYFPQKITLEEEMQALNFAECRICHEEDLEFNLEVPCSCSGSLKHAHRKCIQRWCDEKGDTLCEICLQPFKPDYTSPPKLLHYGSMPMAFRGNWGISRQSLHGPHFIPVVVSDEDLVNSEDNDHHASNSRSIIVCRSIAATLCVLVVLSHLLSIFMSFGDEWLYSAAEILIIVIRAAGILLPVMIMIRALLVIHRRREEIWR